MSNYKEGQTHQLLNALETAGFTADHITKLGQFGNGLQKIIALLDGQAEIVMKKVEEAVIALLTLIKTITTSAVADKKTKNCFTDKKRYYFRDSDLDVWLPKNQPSQTESKFSVQQLAKSATFKKAVESFLGVSGDIDFLAKTLKERGHITTLPVIESLIERQEAGEDVGLRTDGWANFFFVEDKDGSVSVVHADRYGGQWSVSVYRLGYDREWDDERRFFFRN